MSIATRTWFCTFTYTAERADWMRFNAQRFDHKGREYTEAELARLARKDFTGFVKRVREGTRPRRKFRYVVVVELHKSGRPHLHALIHEQDGYPLTKFYLESKWPYGFTNMKLVDGDQVSVTAEYLCKYLTKGNSRINPSQKYGSFGPLSGGNETSPSLESGDASLISKDERSRPHLTEGADDPSDEIFEEYPL